MHIFFPIAGMPVSIFLFLGLGGFVGLISGVFGVGGGFLLTPLLMMVGVSPAIATASDTNQIVAATASGTLAHSRNGNVDFKLGFFILIGGLVGGTYGTTLVSLLRNMGNFDFIVKVLYVLMLGIVGSFMFIESINSMRKSKVKQTQETEITKKPALAWLMHKLPLKMYFSVSDIECSVITLFIVGFFIGILCALLGIGGGFIMVPVMYYMIGLPMFIAIGTNLFLEVFTTINITVAQGTLNHSVDLLLAMVLLVGSSLGAQVGARVGKFIKAEQLRVIFSLIVLGVMVKMLLVLFASPSALITLGGGD